ncbi:MAG: hypothetical protein AABY15_04635 [Nanoarchaeota archaeon]
MELFYITPRHNPEYRFAEVLHETNHNFSAITSGELPLGYLSLSGGTVSGNTLFSLNLSATTFFSGSTDLEVIISNIANKLEDITRVQPGSNITTGGTENLPIISVVDSPFFNNLFWSGISIGNELSATTISGGTIYSGNTNLELIFHNKNGYLLQKSGSVSGSTFSGNPKKSTITFSTNFPDNDYSISVIGTVNRTWTIESKTLSGFTINANANPAFASSEVYWIALEGGEGFR